jgi:peptidoglycan/xylan/chitin deacetylase (PgdA/CDA1 family)
MLLDILDPVPAKALAEARFQRYSTITMSRLRTDRLATLYFFRPIHRYVIGRQELRIPILMYHSISENRVKRGQAHYDMHTSPAVFTEQMRLIHENGYQVVSLDEVITRMESPQQTDQRCVAITFDDGYQDFYSNAFPVLSELGFTATVYLPTKYIGDTRTQFKGKDCLTWNEVRRLQTTGIEFGSHTVTHPQLRLCKPAEIEYELRCSKQTIECELGTAVRSFSYPYAFPENNDRFKESLHSTLRECGYLNGVSTILGTVQNLKGRYFLKRLPVSSADDPSLFLAKLEGGYDWIHPLQYATKLLKSAIA